MNLETLMRAKNLELKIKAAEKMKAAAQENCERSVAFEALEIVLPDIWDYIDGAVDVYREELENL